MSPTEAALKEAAGALEGPQVANVTIVDPNFPSELVGVKFEFLAALVALAALGVFLAGYVLLGT